jgi:hypothetical protein
MGLTIKQDNLKSAWASVGHFSLISLSLKHKQKETKSNLQNLKHAKLHTKQHL